MANKMNNIIMEGARLIFRNFAGAATQYNRAGKRTFSVVIDDADLANTLLRDGWNVKQRPPREEGGDPTYHLPVEARFDNFPPKVVLVTRNGKNILDEESVATLDYAEIKNADVVISPSPWEVNGKTGVKAYLKTAYITIEEDEFADKYDMDEY